MGVGGRHYPVLELCLQGKEFIDLKVRSEKGLPGYKALVQFGGVAVYLSFYRTLGAITRSGLLWDCWTMASGLDFLYS
jgi:hypothetical protein